MTNGHPMTPPREILFRGFHPNENGETRLIINGKNVYGEWVYGGSLVTFLDDDGLSYYLPAKGEGCVAIHNGYGDIVAFESGMFYATIPETVGRCTGVTDINDVAIYEGDVLFNTLFGDLWTVKFRDGSFVIELHEDGETVNLGDVQGFAVVGTVWDSKEHAAA